VSDDGLVGHTHCPKASRFPAIFPTPSKGIQHPPGHLRVRIRARHSRGRVGDVCASTCGPRAKQLCGNSSAAMRANGPKHAHQCPASAIAHTAPGWPIWAAPTSAGNAVADGRCKLPAAVIAITHARLQHVSAGPLLCSLGEWGIVGIGDVPACPIGPAVRPPGRRRLRRLSPQGQKPRGGGGTLSD
jgi:hypothetical protein